MSDQVLATPVKTEKAGGNGHKPHAATKWVYLFNEVKEAENHVGGTWDAVRGLMGGKGANLADMTRLDIPVPPGFTVTTEACNAYLASDNTFPEGMWEQELAAVLEIEKMTGKKFGGTDNPLLVSCRSGAKFSMPGMMDTVLNIGLNDEIAETMARLTNDRRFVFDLYRRLIQMFGSVVMGVPDEAFEVVITSRRKLAGVTSDSELKAADWEVVTRRFKEIYRTFTRSDFPTDPFDQLRLATEAVFKSWNGRRAIDYRNAAGIAHDLGTAVNIQTMVYGNIGDNSATGVAMSRNASTGDNEPEGDFLVNAQGEDVVAGIRLTQPLEELKAIMPAAYDEFLTIARKLEKHYRNMQDMEFTIENGKLWLLQTRDGKRTAQAEVKIAVDMVEEGLINKEEAVWRVKPAQVDFFLHPQLDSVAIKSARKIAKGLNVSPGAAVGMVAFDADTAERWAKEDGRKVIMVRPETKPDDVHGMLAAQGILTSRGGRTSHAALVARQFGKPAVVGVMELDIDLDLRHMSIGEDINVKEGDWISLDGTQGIVYLGQVPTVVPDIKNAYLIKLLGWADDIRTLGVWANADYPRDAQRAREYGAQGIGLCRTEHMFFETARLPIVQQMIMAKNVTERNESLDKLLPLQRGDFDGLFRAMDGQPVIIRLIDPPLHEFLPSYEELVQRLADLKVQLQHFHTLSEIDEALSEIRVKQMYLERVEALREQNPMLGTRGVRLGIIIPELTKMQVRAIFEAACQCQKEGIDVHPEVMIPLIFHVNELKVQQTALEAVAKEVMEEQGVQVAYKFGTMIEIPRAALTADEVAEVAQFFSFGTNDLTQTTFGISRDDAEAGFLVEYQQRNILEENPFGTLDVAGVGKLMKMAVEMGRATRPDLEVGICGEHGGDPKTIAFCHQIGLNYVSCSPFRVPIARLAAAHAALNDKKNN
ncbi:Pyruvate, phosphate dikinase [Candidatus Promineifilum breve]|uniref:Pyruvate, phosphate dikinase n=1 Tax=Candidatus Promineifilum breve TaxID=1806508 RepID=A0A160SZ00_9CHLR|nr:pyruvate, phosphate dikinase [Candidatus Promineifilum breve]CUS02334.2 Pyruvate, phosphate dikinase [Candidatus Promineifilum breve]